MNPTDTIERLASGEAVTILATVIVALAMAVIILYRRNNTLQDKLLAVALEMAEENRALLSQTTVAISANTEVTRQAVRLVEDRRPRQMEDRR